MNNRTWPWSCVPRYLLFRLRRVHPLQW